MRPPRDSWPWAVGHPHLVEPDRLRIRSGHTVEVVVPITVSNQVNMHLVTAGPVTAQLSRGRYTFTQVSLRVDDPTTAVRRLRSLIPRT